MKKNKRSILFFTFFVFFTGLQAQGLADILFDNSKKNYMGQYDFKGKRKNGYGIERYRNGDIYVGDFNKDKITGRGMFIASQGSIAQVEDAVVYIGNWMNGRKEGKGTCYDKLGNVVFHGIFSKDKPINSLTLPEEQRFCTVEIDDELYVGEIKDGVPNGYGLKLRSDGAIQFGTFREGTPRGICMTLFASDVWEVGQWTNGKYRAFNNSIEAGNREQDYRLLTKKRQAEVRSGLFEATINFVQATITLASIVNEMNSGNETSVVSGETEENIPDGKDYDYYLTKYKIWLSKTKNTYEDRVRYKVKANDTRSGRVATAALRLLHTRQKMMRTIRLTAKRNGYDIPMSKYETVTF